MPSQKNPNEIMVGPGKLPANTVSSTALVPNQDAGFQETASTLIPRPVVSGLLTAYPSYVGTGNNDLNVTSGTFWAGDDPAQSISDLFHVVLADNDNIYDSEPIIGTSGLPISVTSLVGASIGDGWVSPTIGSPVTFNFTGTIPSGTNYRIIYGAPQSLSYTTDLSADAMVRSMTPLTLGQMSRINAAVVGGLDERYRRSTAAINPYGVSLDTPGDGATISRDGPALQMRLGWPDTRTGNNPDIFQAAYKAQYVNYIDDVYTTGRGGDIGLVLVATGRMTVSDPGEQSGQGVSRAVASTFIRRDIINATTDGASRTHIYINFTTGVVSGTTLTLDSPWYFQNANGTAIWSGSDIIVLDYGLGVTRSFRIELTANADECTLLPLGTGTVSGVNGAVTVVGWYHSYVDVGGTGGYSMQIRFPRYVGDNQTDANSNGTRAFRMIQANSSLDYMRLDWEDEFATVSFPRFFVDGQGNCGTKSVWSGDLGNVDDGQAKTRASGIMRHAFAQRYLYHTITTDQTYRINPKGEFTSPGTGDDGEGFGAMHIRLNGTASTPILVDFDGANLSDGEGIWFEILIENVTGMDLTLTWPSQAKWSDPSDAVPGPGFVAGRAIKYRGSVWGTSGNVWLMERIDYSL